MRKTLLTLTALAGLVGVGLASGAHAAPIGASVQTIQYYGGPYGGPRGYYEHERWREAEWRRHEEWVRWHRWHEHRDHWGDRRW